MDKGAADADLYRNVEQQSQYESTSEATRNYNLTSFQFESSAKSAEVAIFRENRLQKVKFVAVISLCSAEITALAYHNSSSGFIVKVGI